ncbi:MAG: hypothetical protein WBL35_04765 [Ornithinibacter sp.]
MDAYTAAARITLWTPQTDLARSALPNAPVVDERPSLRSRAAASLVRAAAVLAPEARTLTVARA